MHANLGIGHSAAWNAGVIEPLIAGNSWIAKAIAEGGLMPLKTGQACIALYRAYFGLTTRWIQAGTKWITP